ncbi:MAG: hypothetical protein HC888_17415 [Candidatus Competibacteraceae bacterium]|nr:hypothetical protein [Candidatus Competibacteraceae bacterium]
MRSSKHGRTADRAHDPECNLPEGFSRHAALELRHTNNGTLEGLDTLFDASPADLASVGETAAASSTIGSSKQTAATRWTSTTSSAPWTPGPG